MRKKKKRIVNIISISLVKNEHYDFGVQKA